MGAKAKRAFKKVFGRNAFSRSKSQGLTGKKAFEAKVRAMQAQVEKHISATVKHVKAGGKKIRVTPKYGLPTNPAEQAIAIRDIAQSGAFERKLLKRPRAAALLAEKLKGTKDAKYFAKIAEKAAMLAKEKKHKAFARRQRKTIEKIAARKRLIQKADKQWAEKGRR